VCLATETFDVRIVGGTNNTGRVEIRHQGVWGTVCDDDWDLADANVVCRQIGFSNATNAYHDFSPSGTGHIWLDNVNCTGSESRLQDCPSKPFGDHDCREFNHAGVTCE
jgi:hypothetical protein